MPADQKQASVLIAEDEAEIRRFAARVLDLEGYDVIEVGDGNEALRMVKGNRRIGLLLLDLRLPGQDGWTLLTEMKNDPNLRAIPVVVFSASAADAYQDRALDMGAAAYLVKPLDATKLRQTVAEKIR
jgi:CheY-like chemotaxis protein